tara:strand:+ start:347 stop:493 length:147 start_codon:yes stop_codon:yes gene_type:complete
MRFTSLAQMVGARLRVDSIFFASSLHTHAIFAFFVITELVFAFYTIAF